MPRSEDEKKSEKQKQRNNKFSAGGETIYFRSIIIYCIFNRKICAVMEQNNPSVSLQAKKKKKKKSFYSHASFKQAIWSLLLFHGNKFGQSPAFCDKEFFDSFQTLRRIFFFFSVNFFWVDMLMFVLDLGPIFLMWFLSLIYFSSSVSILVWNYFFFSSLKKSEANVQALRFLSGSLCGIPMPNFCIFLKDHNVDPRPIIIQLQIGLQIALLSKLKDFKCITLIKISLMMWWFGWGLQLYIIIIIMCHEHGFPRLSLPIHLYRLSHSAGLPDYIFYLYRAVVDRF